MHWVNKGKKIAFILENPFIEPYFHFRSKGSSIANIGIVCGVLLDPDHRLDEPFELTQSNAVTRGPRAHLNVRIEDKAVLAVTLDQLPRTVLQPLTTVD